MASIAKSTDRPELDQATATISSAAPEPPADKAAQPPPPSGPEPESLQAGPEMAADFDAATASSTSTEVHAADHDVLSVASLPDAVPTVSMGPSSSPSERLNMSGGIISKSAAAIRVERVSPGAVLEETAGAEATGLFKCSWPGCDRQFSARQPMIRHRYIHTDERPYPCHQCGSRFRCASHLKRHVRLHMKDRPYVCPECSKGFVDHTNMVRHRVQHHQARPYVCHISDCLSGFTLERALRIHLLEAHGFTASPANGLATRSTLIKQEVSAGSKRSRLALESDASPLRAHKVPLDSGEETDSEAAEDAFSPRQRSFSNAQLPRQASWEAGADTKADIVPRGPRKMSKGDSAVELSHDASPATPQVAMGRSRAYTLPASSNHGSQTGPDAELAGRPQGIIAASRSGTTDHPSTAYDAGTPVRGGFFMAPSSSVKPAAAAQGYGISYHPSSQAGPMASAPANGQPQLSYPMQMGPYMSSGHPGFASHPVTFGAQGVPMINSQGYHVVPAGHMPMMPASGQGYAVGGVTPMQGTWMPVMATGQWPSYSPDARMHYPRPAQQPGMHAYYMPQPGSSTYPSAGMTMPQFPGSQYYQVRQAVPMARSMPE